jgi:hypothetical protein
MCRVQIRIISTPPGEAPESVRKAWFGLVLKVHGPIAIEVPNIGVLSSQVAWKVLWAMIRPENKIRGYQVDSVAAIGALRLHAPEAAAWWERHTPYLLQPGQRLVFHEEVCEVVDDGPPLASLA